MFDWSTAIATCLGVIYGFCATLTQLDSYNGLYILQNSRYLQPGPLKKFANLRNTEVRNRSLIHGHLVHLKLIPVKVPLGNAPVVV